MAATNYSGHRKITSCLMDVSFDMDDALTLPTNFGRQISQSISLIAELPAVSSDESDVCSICMDGFGWDSGGKRIPCGHVFHSSCISSWLFNCDSCPLCRFSISAAGRCTSSS